MTPIPTHLRFSQQESASLTPRQIESLQWLEQRAFRLAVAHYRESLSRDPLLTQHLEMRGPDWPEAFVRGRPELWSFRVHCEEFSTTGAPPKE